MFLITTADQNFWKTDETILFLGEWCKIYDRKPIWSELRYTVLPYHWDDRKKMYQDYLYLDQVYEKYLPLLSEKLNEIHDVNYSSKYWRIVAGQWLYQFIEIVFDRYLSIKNATQTDCISDTWICPHDSTLWIPTDIPDFIQYYCSDEYNYYIYSRIIQTLGELPFTIVESKSKPADIINPAKPQESAVIHNIRKLYNYCSKYLPSRINQVVFVETYLDPRDNIQLQLSLGQIPFFEFPHANLECDQTNLIIRKKMVFFSTGSTEFESILDWLIAEQIPRVYVEGYSDLHKRALDSFPEHPKVIFTANAYNGQTLFQLWAAYQVEHGAKLIGMQHGGHYGSGLWSASESHQIRICDRFYTWGWKSRNAPNIRPLSTGKFDRVKKNVSPDPNGTILMVSGSLPRYSYWMYSLPVGPQMLNYINDQYRFIQSASVGVFEGLLLRLYPVDFGWNEASRYRDKFPTLKQYMGEKTIYQQLNESRLFIGTFNTTTYLETFAANFPTVLFWDPKYWELRPSAQPFFDELRTVGILHDTPESAAKKVNEIFTDPLSWWNQDDVQKVLKKFSHQFLRTSPDWRVEWKREFLQILNES